MTQCFLVFAFRWVEMLEDIPSHLYPGLVSVCVGVGVGVCVCGGGGGEADI